MSRTMSDIGWLNVVSYGCVQQAGGRFVYLDSTLDGVDDRELRALIADGLIDGSGPVLKLTASGAAELAR